jgi:hypothetical protein
MKTLNLVLPLIVLLFCVAGMITGYGANNMAAVYANVTAMFGWGIVAMDAWREYKQRADSGDL